MWWWFSSTPEEKPSENTKRRGMTSRIMATSSIVVSAADMVLRERPEVASRSVRTALTTLMVLGLLSFVAAMTLLAAIGFAELVIMAQPEMPGILPDFAKTQAEKLLPQLWRFVNYTMLGSMLYGFASFLWYKLEVSQWIGNWMYWFLFLGVPVILLALKHFAPEIQARLGDPVPAPVFVVGQYYSLFWYVLIFLFAALQFRKTKEERARHAITRWSLLTILCYIPYGYVLFVGEQQFFGPMVKNYAGDVQLIVWMLLPLRR